MYCKIETKCSILEIRLVPERKFSNSNFNVYFDLIELYKFQFQDPKIFAALLKSYLGITT